MFAFKYEKNEFIIFLCIIYFIYSSKAPIRNLKSGTIENRTVRSYSYIKENASIKEHVSNIYHDDITTFVLLIFNLQVEKSSETV